MKKFYLALAVLVAVAAILGATGFVMARTTPTKADYSAMFDSGLKKFYKGDVQGAIQELQTAANGLGDNGEAWFYLGFAQHFKQDFLPARKAFSRAIELEFRPSLCYYNIACGHALLGEKVKALDALDMALGAGFVKFEDLKYDPDLRNLRNEPRFKELLAAFEGESENVEHLRHMQARLGSWNAYDSKGKLSGVLLVESRMNGLVLEEYWTLPNGESIQSFYAYDRVTRSWEQISGSSEGDRRRRVMIEGPNGIIFRDAEGPGRLYQYSWQPEEAGTLIEIREVSLDGGKTWKASESLKLTPKDAGIVRVETNEVETAPVDAIAPTEAPQPNPR